MQYQSTCTSYEFIHTCCLKYANTVVICCLSTVNSIHNMHSWLAKPWQLVPHWCSSDGPYALVACYTLTKVPLVPFVKDRLNKQFWLFIALCVLHAKLGDVITKWPVKQHSVSKVTIYSEPELLAQVCTVLICNYRSALYHVFQMLLWNHLFSFIKVKGHSWL